MTGRDPLVVHVGDLLRRPGTRKDVERDVELHGLALSASAVAAAEDLALHAVLESMTDGIVASGTIEVDWTGQCRRCLAEVEGRLEVPFREIFERRPTEGETYPLQGDHVDLEPLVRETVLLALPLAPLCDDACRGPAPDAFPTEVEGEPAAGEDDADEHPRDPRWAALDALRTDTGD
jgi:uncharacterized protein